MRLITTVLGALAFTAVGGYAAPAAQPAIVFDAPTRVATGGTIYLSTVGDVTGDGRLDVVVFTASYASAEIRTFRGRGDGTFHAAVLTPVTDAGGVLRMRTARIDADAASDLVLLRDDGTRVRVDVLRADGTGGFAAGPSLREDRYPYLGGGGVPCDWNGDGATDIVTETLVEGGVRVYLNDGQGRFPSFESIYGSRGLSGTNDLVAADLDGDGRPDLARQSSVHWRFADGSLVNAVALKPGSGLYLLGDPVTEDLDGDGLRDLAMVMVDGNGTRSVAVFLHTGARTFAPVATYHTPSPVRPHSVHGLAAADLDGDGRVELITETNVLVNDGAGGFGTSVPLPVGGLTRVAVGNVDADARPDLVAIDGVPGAATDIVVIPVRSSAPAPYVVSMEPPTLTYGRTQTVVLRGTGFAAGDTVDFGPGTRAGVVSVDSATQIVAVVLTEVSFGPGGRLLSVTSPGGAVGRAPFAFVSETPPLFIERRLDSLTPDHARQGETLDIVLAGTGLPDAASLWLGTDTLHVNSATALGDGRTVLNVTVSEAAALGRRDVSVFTFLGEMSIETCVPNLFEIQSPRSLDLHLYAGKLAPAGRPKRGTFSVSGALSFNGYSPDSAFDPATETAEIRVGDPSAPVVVDVPAGAGWRVRGRRAMWTSPRGSTPSVHLVLDHALGTFRLDVARADLPAPTSGDVLVEVTLGDETGTSVRRWTTGRRGSLLLR